MRSTFCKLVPDYRFYVSIFIVLSCTFWTTELYVEYTTFNVICEIVKQWICIKICGRNFTNVCMGTSFVRRRTEFLKSTTNHMRQRLCDTY